MTVKRLPIKLPRGFQSSGICAGIKQEVNRKDLGLIYSKNDLAVGGVYTQNKFPSAHVQYCRDITPAGNIRAFIVNSGNANAATGQKGIEANQLMVEALSKHLGINADQVLTSSTGIIGHDFPVQVIKSAMPSLISELTDDGFDFASAIMTTDLKEKTSVQQISIEGQDYSVVGFAKGSGMINPNMATMLAYVLTDAPLPLSNIQEITRKVNSRSFNCISVDGDTSTNDSFYLASSNSVSALTDSELAIVTSGIEAVAVDLAKQIAGDGEGAEHLIEVTVSKGPSEAIVRKVLDSILNSSLVKTAINGNDPNWGRILMAAGNGLSVMEYPENSAISIKIQDTPVFTKGEPVSYSEASLSNAMSDFNVHIEVDLHNGTHSLKGWGCDFSDEYVRINADYST